MRPNKHFSKWDPDIKEIWYRAAKLAQFKIPCESRNAANALRQQLYLCRKAFIHVGSELPTYHKIKQFQISRTGSTLIFTRTETKPKPVIEEI